MVYKIDLKTIFFGYINPQFKKLDFKLYLSSDCALSRLYVQD